MGKEANGRVRMTRSGGQGSPKPLATAAPPVDNWMHAVTLGRHDALILRMLGQGIGVRRIGEIVGCCPATLRRHLLKLHAQGKLP